MFDYNVYVGTVRGALAHTQCKPSIKTKYELTSIDSEVTSMEWATNEQIAVGTKAGHVKIYHIGLEKYIKNISEELVGKGFVAGIGIHEKKLVIGKENGIVNVWNDGENDSFSLDLDEKSSMLSMAYEAGKVATGGEKNDLKVWDLEQKKEVFKSKSMGHDMLNLPIPTTVRSICFFPEEEKLVACCTKEGHVLLYDQRAQRRPVSKIREAKASYTTIAFTFRDRQCMVGTTRGYMQMVDFKKNKVEKTFTSFTGGITGIRCIPMEPYVVSTCLDRHLRVHNLDSKELVYKEYMKMSLCKVLLKPIVKEEPEEEKEEEFVDEEYAAMFENMETINEEVAEEPVQKKKKKGKLLKNIFAGKVVEGLNGDQPAMNKKRKGKMLKNIFAGDEGLNGDAPKKKRKEKLVKPAVSEVVGSVNEDGVKTRKSTESKKMKKVGVDEDS